MFEGVDQPLAFGRVRLPVGLAGIGAIFVNIDARMRDRIPQRRQSFERALAPAPTTTT